MFDVSWSELLILGLVTLIFVGPKELPRFLNTLGRYLGVIRRQANEFRAVFDQAMREAEMEEIQKQVRAVGDGVKASLDTATRSVESATAAAGVEPDAKPALETKPADAGAGAGAKALPAGSAGADAAAQDAPSSEPDRPAKPQSETAGPV